MVKQRVHIISNLCDSPLAKGLLGYEWIICNEANCAYFENDLP